MPRITNLFTSPQSRLISDGPVAQGQRQAVIEVEGLLCRYCACRVRRALASLPGVEQVSFDRGRDRFAVTYRGALGARDFRRAVRSVVIAPRLRDLLARS